jgi:hypothetical protein
MEEKMAMSSIMSAFPAIMTAVVFFIVPSLAILPVLDVAQAASCDAVVGKWAWFIGGEVTVNRNGTFTQQSGNAGTWECTDSARGQFTFRWRDGGFVNSVAVSPDGQGLTSLDQSQWYVTAQRSAPAPQPQPAREEDCCREAYACEVKKIQAEFAQKSAQCRGYAGNAPCFREAVSTKASGLQAAGEKLRQCNRADTPGVMPPGGTTGNQAPSGGLSTRDLPPPPSSSDEFHSTERTGDPCQCVPHALQYPGSNDTIPAEEILTPEGKRLLFKLGAEMNEIAKDQAGRRDPGSEFLGGLAEWASGTLEFLAQKPGAPVEQMVTGIIDYLTNNNAANHRALRGAAEQAVREFQQNPARFLGKNLPDMLPTPAGPANKARALQRMAQVEKAADRLKGIANAEKKLERFYEKVGPASQGYGEKVQNNTCLAINSCVDEALAEAHLFKTGGPAGDGTPWKIVGVRGLQTPKFPDAPSRRPPLTPDSPNWPKDMPYDPNQPLLDLRHDNEQLYAKLEPYGDGFATRRPGTYNPEQLDMIWSGRPIPMEGPDQIANILRREGIGSQGLVIVDYKQPKGNVSGHVVNFQNPDGKITVRDSAHVRMDVSEVENWFFFPIY